MFQSCSIQGVGGALWVVGGRRGCEEKKQNFLDFFVMNLKSSRYGLREHGNDNFHASQWPFS